MTSRSNEVRDGLEVELDALWQFGWRLTGDADDAAELVQRTCLRALERSDSYRTRGRLRSWLFRIEHRLWLNELRSRRVRRHRPLGAGGPADADGSGEDVALEAALALEGETRFAGPESAASMGEVRAAVDALPDAQRVTMILVCVEGCSYRETAEILEVPIGTVMSRLSRARLAVGARFADRAPAPRAIDSSPRQDTHAGAPS